MQASIQGSFLEKRVSEDFLYRVYLTGFLATLAVAALFGLAVGFKADVPFVLFFLALWVPTGFAVLAEYPEYRVEALKLQLICAVIVWLAAWLLAMALDALF